MNNNNWQNLTLKKLEKKIAAPAKSSRSCRTQIKTFYRISRQATKNSKKNMKWYFRICNYGASTAAAVLIFALILTMNSALSIHAKMLPTELDDISLSSPGLFQLNSLYDQNDTSVTLFLPKDLK